MTAAFLTRLIGIWPCYYKERSVCIFIIYRNCLGTRNLGEILSEKESIAGEMKEVLDVATKPWGVKVERVEVMI